MASLIELPNNQFVSMPFVFKQVRFQFANMPFEKIGFYDISRKGKNGIGMSNIYKIIFFLFMISSAVPSLPVNDCPRRVPVVDKAQN